MNVEQELLLVKEFSELTLDWPLQELDANGLLKLLHEMPKGEPLIITTETLVHVKAKAKLKGTLFENPWKGERIIKRSRVATRAKPIYSQELKRRTIHNTETPSLSKPRKWGQRLIGTPFVVHMPKGGTEMRMYLEVIVLKSLGHQYYLQGTDETISSKQIEPFLPHRGSLSISSPGVIWRDYDIRNIVILEASGNRYVVSKNFKLEHDSERLLIQGR